MNDIDSTLINNKLIKVDENENENENEHEHEHENTSIEIELKNPVNNNKKNYNIRKKFFTRKTLPPNKSSTKKSVNNKKQKNKKKESNNENNHKKQLEMMYFLSDKIYGSTSWKKYVNETSPVLLKNLLNINKFKSIVYQKDTKEIDNLSNEQDRNLKLSEMFTKSYCDLKIASQINGWNYRRTEIARQWHNELAYLYVVNYYFMFSLKTRESKWSWILIVFSSICSILTIINSDQYYIQEFVRYTLSLLAVCTSLVAAYIKKENYVERIKELDRYTQKVGKINTEINNVIKQKPWNRMNHDAFIDKYLNETNALLSAPPPMSPLEFKTTVYNLTKYYPELIVDVYPWYNKKKFGDVEYYEMTDWGERILHSYNRFQCCNTYSKNYSCFAPLFQCCNSPCRKDTSNIFLRHKHYNDIILTTLHSERSLKQNIAKKAINENITDNLSDSENNSPKSLDP